MRLSRNQKNQAKKMAQRYNLELILIFGSRVAGKIHSNSDLDVAVLPKAGNNFNMRNYSLLLFALEKVFPGVKIDLSFIDRADPLLLKHISETALLLFGKRRAFIEFQLKAFKYFQDYLPYFKLEENGVHKRLKELSYGR